MHDVLGMSMMLPGAPRQLCRRRPSSRPLLASGPPLNWDLLVDMAATTLAYAVVQREPPEVYVVR